MGHRDARSGNVSGGRHIRRLLVHTWRRPGQMRQRCEHGSPMTCSSCDCPLTSDEAERSTFVPLCRECRSPLTTLDFPELYCDLGGGD